MKRLIILSILLVISSVQANPPNVKKIFYLSVGSASPSSNELFEHFYDNSFTINPQLGFSISKTFEMLTEFSYFRFPPKEKYTTGPVGNLSLYQAGFGLKANLIKNERIDYNPFLIATIGVAFVKTAPLTAMTYYREYYQIQGQKNTVMYYSIGAGIELKFILLKLQSNTVIEGYTYNAVDEHQTTTVVTIGVSIR